MCNAKVQNNAVTLAFLDEDRLRGRRVVRTTTNGTVRGTTVVVLDVTQVDEDLNNVHANSSLTQ